MAGNAIETSFKGELEYELIAPPSNSPVEWPFLQIDKAVIQPMVRFGDGIEIDGQYYIQENRSYLNEMHVKFTGLEMDSYLDFGKFERYLKDWHGRKTELYPLLGTAFYRDDYIQAAWHARTGSAWLRVSAGNGLQLAEKKVGKDDSEGNIILHDNANTENFEAWEVGLNVGLDFDLDEGQSLSVIGLYYSDKMSDDEIEFLFDKFPGYWAKGDAKTLSGGGLKFKMSSLEINGLVLKSALGALDVLSYTGDLSWSFNTGRDLWFTKMTPVLSYSVWDIYDDHDNDAAFDLSLDRTQILAAMLVDLYDKVKLKLEYSGLGEVDEDIEIDNNELLLQLEVKF